MSLPASHVVENKYFEHSTGSLQVVRDATFTAAPEVGQKAKIGRKVTPTPVDQPAVNRSFAAAAGALAFSPASGGSLGQVSAGTAYDSARSGASWPSLADTPQAPSEGSETTSMRRANPNSITRSRQPSPLSCTPLSASAKPGTAADVFRETSGCASKQDSLAQRLGDMHLSSGRSDCATAGTSPWTQRAPAQSSSEAVLTSVSPWDSPGHAQQAAPGAASSAASNTPWRASPPRSRGVPAVAVTPGSAVSVSSRLKPPDLQCSSTSERQGLSVSPTKAAPQTTGSKVVIREPSSQGPEDQSGPTEALLDKSQESGQPAQLSQQAQRAARMHSALIRHTASIQLAAELESLLRLLALPAGAKDDAADGSTLCISSGEAAAEYACCVLSTIGRPITISLYSAVL